MREALKRKIKTLQTKEILKQYFDWMCETKLEILKPICYEKVTRSHFLIAI